MRYGTDTHDASGFYWAMSIARANLLLAALPEVERRRLIAMCDEVEVSFGHVLCAQGDHIRHVYFPTGSFISMLVETGHDPDIEVGVIGAEGVVGITLALQVNTSPVRAIVQGSGPALRISAARFSRELDRSRAFRSVVSRYLYVLISQLVQMSACVRFHTIEARLARWLLMTRDRAHSDDFYLTQELMASMLGVRRPGITRAASLLQRRRLIRYRRGHLTILDARHLEAVSCPCYAISNDIYALVMGRRDTPPTGAWKSGLASLAQTPKSLRLKRRPASIV